MWDRQPKAGWTASHRAVQTGRVTRLKSEPEPEPDTMRFVEHLPTVLSCCGLSR